MPGAQVGAAEWLPAQNYYFPLEGAAQAAVEDVWARLLAEDGAQEAAVTLPVIYGRSLEVCDCCTHLLVAYPALLQGLSYHMPRSLGDAGIMPTVPHGCWQMSLIQMRGTWLRQVARAGRSAARFDFDDICSHPLGPADYFALAQAFQTVLITNVPDFSLQVRLGITS